MLKRAGRYEIIAELGHGGFGQVYRAFDPQLDSMVAVKTLSVEKDAAVLTRFRNEAAASRRLRHPNIVTIYDFGEQDGTPFIVMELLDGQDLKNVIDSHKVLPLWHKLQIMAQIASGLAHAHANGIVHRDVKPANVMLLPDGNIKIMDFGIALMSRDTQNRVTPKGAVIGTFRYLAPEQFRGLPQDARGDIFAYGLTFYELLSGVHPFHSREDAAVMYNILSLEPVSILEVCPGCPEQIQPVISRLLQKDPDFRYQNLEDVLFDCEPVLLQLKRDRARDLFEEAKVALANRQLDGAQTLLRQAMELDTAYPGARELRERLHTELRRVAVRPRAEALANEGRELLAAGNPADAVQRYEAAFRLDPTDGALKSSLDQAKDALKLSREIARLVADAERSLFAGDLTNAYRIAQQAEELAPAEARSRDIGAKVRAALAERDRQAQLVEDLARVRRLIEIRSWDEASPLLDRLERGLDDTSEIRALRKTLEAGRFADERQRRLDSGLAAGRQEIHAGRLENARQGLAELRAEFPDSAEVEHLYQFASAEIEARKQSNVVDHALRSARAFADQSRFEEAARVLQSALLSYPSDPVLQRELRSVSAAQQQAERNAALSKTLSWAKTLQNQGRFDGAMAAIETFSSEYGSQAEVEELRQSIERDREAAARAAEIRDMVRHVDELLAQGHPEEATRILQRPLSGMEHHPELTKLRTRAKAQLEQQMERQAALQEALAAAKALREQASLEQAAVPLAAFTARYGPDSQIAELERSLQEESQRRAEELHRLVGRTTELLSQGKALEATKLLESGPGYLKEHQEVTRLRQKAEARVQEYREREAALDGALSLASSREQQNRFEEAFEALDAFVDRYGVDDRIAARKEAIQRTREEASRVAEIQDLTTRAQSLMEQGHPQAVLSMLEQAGSLVDASPDLRELQNAAGAVIAARQTREAVDVIVAETQYFLEHDELQGALETIDRGLKRFPNEATLAATRVEILATQATRRREEYYARAVAEIDSLIVQHDYGRASNILAEASRECPDDARLLPLEAQIEAHRQAWEALRTELKIRDEIARAREMLPARPAEALATMERLLAEYPGNPDLVAAVAEIREGVRAAEERSLIQQAEQLCARNQFSEAAATLNRAGQETPELQAARQNVESRRAAAEANRIAEALAAVRETAAANPAKALRALQKLQVEFPQHLEIAATIGECRAAIREHERQTFIAEIRNLCTQGKFSKARARHQQAVAQLGADAGLADLLAWIEESAAARETGAGESARQPRRQTWAWLGAGLGVAAMLGAGTWVLMHRRAPSPAHKEAATIPVEIRSDPAGASIQVGDRTCVTPNCQFDLPPGHYSVQAQFNGYVPAQQTLIVDAATNASSLNFTLQPVPAAPPPAGETGILIVKAGMPDALVSVDDQKWRTDSAGTIRVPLAPKSYRITVEKSGYDAAPAERQVRISNKGSQTVVFSLSPRDATLVVRGAPAGWEISTGGALIGRTDGTPFTKPVKPGDQILRISQGPAIRETPQRFEPGGTVTLDWASIAPVVTARPPLPPPVDPAERDWGVVSATSDPAVIQKYIENYPAGAHAADARSRLEAVTWPRVNRDDVASLRAYLSGFPAGPHAREAQSRIDELIWNNVDKNNVDAVRSYIAQNGDSAFRAQAQAIIDQFERQKLDTEARLKQDRINQEEEKKKLDLERGKVLAVLDRLNVSFAQHRPGDLRTIWQNPPDAYRRALDSSTHTLLKLGCQAPNIMGDMATVPCIQTAQAPQQSPPPQQVKVTLQKFGSDWMVQSILAVR